MSDDKFIFLFSKFNNNDIRQMDGAPRLVPPGHKNSNDSKESAQHIQNQSQKFYAIDVVNNFQWTTTPKQNDDFPGGRKDVPVINLREKRLKTNSLLAQAAYYSATMAGTISDAFAKFDQLSNVQKIAIGATLGVAGGYSNRGLGGGIGETVGNIFKSDKAAVANEIGGLIGQAFTVVGGGALGAAAATNSNVVKDLGAGLGAAGLDSLDNTLRQFGSENTLSIKSLNSSVLKPYEGLYLTEDTGFVYSFPYLSNEQSSLVNSFGDEDEAFHTSPFLIKNQSLGGFVRDFRSSLQATAAITNITAPGVYIEKPKFFRFADKGEKITFNFPLINTGHSNWYDVQKNWQLLFMLIYQNRPNRRSRDLIDPPCIYEMNIPGIKYMPFCFISELTIDFIGNRRQVSIDIPGMDGKIESIATIIPDAYQVTITLEGLVAEAQNMLYAMLTDKQNLVTTTESGNQSLGNFIRQAAIEGSQRNLKIPSTSIDSGSNISKPPTPVNTGTSL